VAASFNTPTLFQIAKDLAQMQIETSIAEADIGGIKDGLQARFRVDAFPGQFFRGSVRQVRLNPTIQSNVVSYTVIVGAENPDGKLKPGMTAFVQITANRKDGVLRVPNAALRFRPPPMPDGCEVRRARRSHPAGRGRRDAGTSAHKVVDGKAAGGAREGRHSDTASPR
jgi:HlyD family secretion protein